jgi:hypothetical protein
VKPKVSLTDYAKAHPGRGTCRVCQSEYRKDLEEAHAGGVPVAVMFRWLRNECGVEDLSDSALRHHFVRARHHEQKA